MNIFINSTKFGKNLWSVYKLRAFRVFCLQFLYNKDKVIVGNRGIDKEQVDEADNYR